jgi:hypothetical protein
MLPETVQVCYAPSDHCVCAMCSVLVHLVGDDYNLSVKCGCIVAADLPNDEEHAKRVLSIITNVSQCSYDT